MTYPRAYLSIAYWKKGFSLRRAVAAVLASFGALWLLIEVSTYFSPPMAEHFRQYWGVFLGLGILGAAWDNRPILSTSCRLNNRDVTLTITVGNIFKCPGALVVGSNTVFETGIGTNLISPTSVQGQFTTKYFDSPGHLSNAIAGTRISTPPLPDATLTQHRNVYPVGACARVTGKGRTGYMVAIATLNAHGVAQGTFNDLQNSLPLLWEFIATRGSMEPLVMPVLGTGFSRLIQTRERVIREIVTSFVAACSGLRFTDSLTIVISENDFYEHKVDLVALSHYLQHVCTYTTYDEHAGPRVGKPAA